MRRAVNRTNRNQTIVAIDEMIPDNLNGMMYLVERRNRDIRTGSLKQIVLATSLLLFAVPCQALDLVRVETHVDQAFAKYGVTGKGVIFAMIDRGIDWRNNDFRNSDGSTRIAAILDLTDSAGASAASNPYGKGTLYTQNQINQALAGAPPLAERDYLGHGTANTAIAAGGGRNNPKYRGIAPEATIVAVKLVNDATPAFRSTPAVAAFYDPSLVPIALKFVADMSKQLNMPAVTVLDIGSFYGPTDGTSGTSRLFDATVGMQAGLVLIPGSGDDGGSVNHAGGSIPQNGSVTLRLKKGAVGQLYFDLWYGGSDAFDVAIQAPDTTYGPFKAPSNSSYDVRNDLGELTYAHFGSNVANYFDTKNGKREIFIVLDAASPNGEYDITLKGTTVTNGRFDALINPSRESDGSNANFFLNFGVTGSLADGATAHNVLTTACYVNRTAWIDIDGIARNLLGQGVVGGIWAGQSAGPTFDGRLGIDVAAPAEGIVTTYDPDSYWATARFNMINDGNDLYGFGGANSSSNPVVAGIVALMLQKNPALDAFTVKDILHKSARADSFTGPVPNAIWRYGKIDALRALDLMTSTKPPSISAIVNAASFVGGPLAPGEIFALTGANLGPPSVVSATELTSDSRFMPSLNGSEVWFDGVPAPMIYSSAGQLAGVVPYEVTGKTSVAVKVQYEGVSSQTITAPIGLSSPAVFLAPALGLSQAAALNENGTVNSAQSPEFRGNIVVLYVTGEGTTFPAGVDGAIAISVFPKPILPVAVTIGGINAAVLYYGATPSQIAGLMQINVRIPAAAPTGDQIPVAVSVGDTVSPANATIAIR